MLLVVACGGRSVTGRMHHRVQYLLTMAKSAGFSHTAKCDASTIGPSLRCAVAVRSVVGPRRNRHSSANLSQPLSCSVTDERTGIYCPRNSGGPVDKSKL